MWFELILDILAATILMPVIIGAVVTYGERRKRIAINKAAPGRTLSTEAASRSPERLL